MLSFLEALHHLGLVYVYMLQNTQKLHLSSGFIYSLCLYLHYIISYVSASFFI